MIPCTFETHSKQLELNCKSKINVHWTKLLTLQYGNKFIIHQNFYWPEEAACRHQRSLSQDAVTCCRLTNEWTWSCSPWQRSLLCQTPLASALCSPPSASVCTHTWVLKRFPVLRLKSVDQRFLKRLEIPMSVEVNII